MTTTILILIVIVIAFWYLKRLRTLEHNQSPLENTLDRPSYICEDFLSEEFNKFEGIPENDANKIRRALILNFVNTHTSIEPMTESLQALVGNAGESWENSLHTLRELDYLQYVSPEEILANLSLDTLKQLATTLHLEVADEKNMLIPTLLETISKDTSWLNTIPIRYQVTPCGEKYIDAFFDYINAEGKPYRDIYCDSK